MRITHQSDAFFQRTDDEESTKNFCVDYSVFGMMMPGRNFNSSGYEYGYNGKRMDNEIKGVGNSYDFGARIYDPRIARFLSVDPMAKTYPFMSTYNYAKNNPVSYIDYNGEGPIWFLFGKGGVSLGVGYGYGVLSEQGTAYDSYGKTYYTKDTYFTISEQLKKNYDSSPNPEVIIAGELGVSGGVGVDWSNDYFMKAAYGSNASFGASLGVGVETDFSSSLSLSIGISAGFKAGFNVGETKVQSFSVSDDEFDKLNESNKNGAFESDIWNVSNVTEVLNDEGTVIGYKAHIKVRAMTTQAWKTTDVTVFSLDKNVWYSKDYIKNVKEDLKGEEGEEFANYFYDVADQGSKSK